MSKKSVLKTQSKNSNEREYVLKIDSKETQFHAYDIELWGLHSLIRKNIHLKKQNLLQQYEENFDDKVKTFCEIVDFSKKPKRIVIDSKNKGYGTFLVTYLSNINITKTHRFLDYQFEKFIKSNDYKKFIDLIEFSTCSIMEIEEFGNYNERLVVIDSWLRRVKKKNIYSKKDNLNNNKHVFIWIPKSKEPLYQISEKAYKKGLTPNRNSFSNCILNGQESDWNGKDMLLAVLIKSLFKLELIKSTLRKNAVFKAGEVLFFDRTNTVGKKFDLKHALQNFNNLDKFERKTLFSNVLELLVDTGLKIDRLDEFSFLE